VIYKIKGKLHEERVGRQYADQMTPSKAALLRSDFIEGRKLPAKEIREQELAEKATMQNKPTISNLWEEYKKTKPNLKGMITDQNRFKNHIKPLFGKKTPEEINL
jgi:predicted glycosyl hydrolase (DUF1957 family)